jgi:hypothetical protein
LTQSQLFELRNANVLVVKIDDLYSFFNSNGLVIHACLKIVEGRIPAYSFRTTSTAREEEQVLRRQAADVAAGRRRRHLYRRLHGRQSGLSLWFFG